MGSSPIPNNWLSWTTPAHRSGARSPNPGTEMNSMWTQLVSAWSLWSMGVCWGNWASGRRCTFRSRAHLLFSDPPKIHRFLNTVITGSLFSCFLPMKCVLPSYKFVLGMSWPLSCYPPLGLLRKTLHYVFFPHLPVANILTNYACRVLRVNLNTPPKTFLCISEKFLIYLNLFAIFLSHLTLAFVCLCAHMHVILALHPLYPIAPPSLLWCVTLCIGLITFCTCTPTHGALC